MKFPEPLIPGTLIKRYKRFLADVRLDDGTEVTAHCANPGSLMGLHAPGSRVWLSPASNPKRKLKWNWELIEADPGDGCRLVGINTSHPNKLVEEAILNGTIAELQPFTALRREVKYGQSSRIDILLERDGYPDTYVEVKNVHLVREPGLVEFPDSVTSRGAKHLDEMGDMVEAGHRAVMVYLVQYPGCAEFALARDLDPKYGEAFDRALSRGVEAICYACEIDETEISVRSRLPLQMNDQN